MPNFPYYTNTQYLNRKPPSFYSGSIPVQFNQYEDFGTSSPYRSNVNLNNIPDTSLQTPSTQALKWNPTSDYWKSKVQATPNPTPEKKPFFTDAMYSDKSGVGAIGSTVAGALPGENGEFSVDPNAGFKGSFKGLGSGGVAGAIIGGVGGQIKEFSRVNKALKNLQTNIDPYSVDANGNPIFNSDAYTAGLRNIGELNKGEKSTKVLGEKGGRGIDPATAAFASIMGTRRKIQRKRDELTRGLTKAASDYNTADTDSRNLNNQMEDYYQRMNKRNRLYNVYKTQF